MKTRTIVWAIVGIIVVLAVIFTIIARRGATPTGRRMDARDYSAYQTRTMKRMEKFEARYNKKAAEITNPTPEEKAKMDEITSKLATLKDYLAEFDKLTTEDEMKEWYEKCKTTEKEIREAYRELFRKEAEE